MAIIPYLALSLVDSRSGILRRAFLAAMARRGAGVPACAFRDVEVDIRAFGIGEFLHPPFARPEERKRDFESTVFRAVLDHDKPLPALALCNGDAFAGFRAGQDDGLVIDRLQRLYDSNRRAFAYYELFRLAPFPPQSIRMCRPYRGKMPRKPFLPRSRFRHAARPPFTASPCPPPYQSTCVNKPPLQIPPRHFASSMHRHYIPTRPDMQHGKVTRHPLCLEQASGNPCDKTQQASLSAQLPTSPDQSANAPRRI